jgi:hypothetical protein
MAHLMPANSNIKCINWGRIVLLCAGMFSYAFLFNVVHAQTDVLDSVPAFEISGGSSSGALGIKRIDLAFDNGLPQITLNSDDSVFATAIINFSGSGLLRAVWKLDGQIIEQVNIPLSFGSILKLPLSKATKLSTIEVGKHILSLEVQSPAVGLTMPRIQYFVVPTKKAHATLHVRPMGAELWQKWPLEINSQGAIDLVIPKALMISPGLEYYIEMISADGKVTTDPVKQAARNPHQLKIESDTPVDVMFMDGNVQQRSPSAEIQISFDQKDLQIVDLSSVHIILDDMDVTGLVDIRKDRLVFTPPAPLPDGSHKLIVTSGREDEKQPLAEIDFSVLAASEKSNNLYAKGNLAFQYGVNSTSDGESSRANGNIALGFGGRYGGTEYAWNGININYDKDADSQLDLSAGFIFTASNDNKQFEYGDISISESPLTVSGFSRRGMKASVENENSKVKLFVVGAEQVTGFDSGFSSGNDNQVYGGSYAINSLGGGPINLKVITLMGENAGEFGDSVASNAAASKGQTIGVQTDTKIGETWFGLDAGWSSYDDDLLDSIEAQSDVAFNLSLKRKLFSTLLSATYLRYGSDYATIANPNFSGDRQGGTLAASRVLGPASLNLQLSSMQDNLEKDVSRAVVTSSGTNINLSLAWPDRPRFNFSVNQSNQKSSDEPNALAGVKNTNQSFNAGISYGGQGWSSALNYNKGELDDQLATDNDSTTSSYSLNGSLQGNQSSISTNLSTSISESSAIENTSNIIGVHASAIIVPEQLTLNSNFNIQKASASDNSVDNESKTAALVLNYNAESILKSWQNTFPGNLQMSLSLNYRQQTDLINTEETDDLMIFLNIGFGMPLRFQKDWQDNN